MKQQLLQQQQQQTRPHLSPDEFGVYRRILYINKTALHKVTVYDFQSEFYDISTGKTYNAHNIKYVKKLLHSLKYTGYVIASSKRTKPQGYYAKEYEHLDNSAVTLDMTHAPNPAQLGNSSSSFAEPRDLSELLNFGIHDILFCPRVKDSHKKFIDSGLERKQKKEYQGCHLQY